MTRDLTVHQRPPAEGDATSLVVFLHGYGADGKDLLSLADPLMPHMPGTAFAAPDAPDRSQMNPMGYQWSPIPWIDGSSEAAAASAFQASANDVNAMLDALMAEHGLAPEQVILFGFSQGSMLSMHVALRRADEIAGVVAFSGRLLVPERLGSEMVSKPPILLVHGDQDEVVPFDSMAEAGRVLDDAGVQVLGHVMRGTGHGIAPDGLQIALAFMRERLGMD